MGLKIIWNGKFVFPYFIEWFSLFTQKQNQSFLVLSVYYFKKFFVYAVVNFNLPTEQQGLTRNSMDFARYKIIYFPVDAMLSLLYFVADSAKPLIYVWRHVNVNVNVNLLAFGRNDFCFQFCSISRFFQLEIVNQLMDGCLFYLLAKFSHSFKI